MGDPNLEQPTPTLKSIPTPTVSSTGTEHLPLHDSDKHTGLATEDVQSNPKIETTYGFADATANAVEPRRMSDLLARSEPPAEHVAVSEPAPVIQQEGAQKIADLKTERDLTLQGSLGDLTQADRKKIGEIDKNLASLNTVNEPVPSYLGTPKGWDAETPSATPQVLNTTQEVQAAEPIISPISRSPEPVITAAPNPGFVDRLKGLFVGRKPQNSGI